MISYHFGDFISFCYAIKEFIGSCFALLFIASFSNLLVALRQGLTSRLLWSDPNQAEVKYATTDSRFDRSGASEPSEANWFTNYLRWVMFVCIQLYVLFFIHFLILMCICVFYIMYIHIMTRNMLSVHHFVQSVLEVVQTFVNFFIMISVMTLNGWLILSIMLGYGVGYFFFRANYKKQQHSSSSHHQINT